MMGAIVSDWVASLVNLGDVGSSYDIQSLGHIVSMSLCELHDTFVMIGVRVVSIWCNAMLLRSFPEGIVHAQVKVESGNAPADSCKRMRWCGSCLSLQSVRAVTDVSFVEESSSSICGFRDDKVCMGDLDTSVRYINSNVEKWLIVAKNKDEEDDGDDDEDDNEEEDDDEDEGDEEGPEDGDEGGEGLEGEGSDEGDEEDEDDDDNDDDEGNGGEEDDQDEDRDDEENGKEGDEDGEEDGGVEDDDNEGENDDDEEEDEDEEPPKKRRK